MKYKQLSIRAFNSLGIEWFQNILEKSRSGEKVSIDLNELQKKEYSTSIGGNLKLEQKEFSTKAEIAKYLKNKLDKIEEEDILFNIGLWTWLSAFYFDIVCPPDKNGVRNPLEDAKYILESPNNWKKYYRHLLASPVRMLEELGDDAFIYLNAPVYEHGEIQEQLLSRREIAASPGIIQAVKILYWDSSKKEFKKGFRTRNKPGDLRRFARNIIPQFQMTYDLNSMTGDQIVDLLPSEFDKWKS